MVSIILQGNWKPSSLKHNRPLTYIVLKHCSLKVVPIYFSTVLQLFTQAATAVRAQSISFTNTAAGSYYCLSCSRGLTDTVYLQTTCLLCHYNHVQSVFFVSC
jgi:hypothetical protein